MPPRFGQHSICPALVASSRTVTHRPQKTDIPTLIPRPDCCAQILVRTPVLPLPATLDPLLLSSDPSLPALPAYPGQDESGDSKPRPQWYRTGVVAEISTEGTVWLDESDSRALTQ